MDFIIHVMGVGPSLAFLADKPPGTSVLRLERSPTGAGKYRLVVSYNFNTVVEHYHFDRLLFKITLGQGTEMHKLKTSPKNYKFIRKLATEFLPTLCLFITEFVNNHNFVEKDLDDSTLESELAYRTFVIFPRDNRIIIKRKVEKDVLQASIGFDWINLGFFAEDDEGVSSIKSFNEFLLDFLQIDLSDKFLVRAALGYQKDMEIYPDRSGMNPSVLTRTASIKTLNTLETLEMDENLSAIVNSKDKIKYLDSLKEFLDREEKSTKSWKTLPKDITTILMALYECCQSLQKVSEKTDLINRGLFASLLQIINRNGPNEEANEYPILILEELCDDNPECCNACCKSFVTLLKTSGQWESSGIYQTLNRLCDRSLFQTTFIKHLGAPLLLELYVKASIMLVGAHQTNTMGEILLPARSLKLEDSHDSDDSDPKEEFISIPGADDRNGDLSHEEKEKDPKVEDKRVVQLKIGGTIPKLNLATTQDKKDKSSRSTRRISFEANKLTQEDRGDAEFALKPSAELNALATNLGETYMTKDLTMLLAFLREAQDKKSVLKTKKVIDSTNEEDLSNHPSLLALIESTHYRIKIHILSIFSRLTFNKDLINFIPNPVNLLYTELLVAHKHNYLSFDQKFRDSIYKVLDNFSDYVLFQHQTERSSIAACAMPYDQQKGYRQKMDKFVWRLHNRLALAVEAKDYPEIDLQLKLLSEYLRYCHTFVSSQQVSFVCMETLVSIKEMIWVSWMNDRTLTFQLVSTFQNLICVFDQLILHNSHGPFNEWLVNLLIEQTDFWKFSRYLLGQVLLNKTFEKEVICSPKNPFGKTKLATFRAGLVFHFSTCIELMQRQIIFYTKKEKQHMPFAKEAKDSIVLHFESLESLIHPSHGYFLQFLTSCKTPTSHYRVVTEILQCIEALFSAKE
eukprot:TRINITY_DN6713_c0_g1_i1.p1 TRINITY_DN6713_c0_g1~~TRINITY_DN6713_c0_g1_i1.p1  ORF type:complete len:969 (-),score=513.02 TRINITY_DN6713_c0_g1_i1:97-2832(-)